MNELTEFLLARIAEDEDLADRSIQVGDQGAALVSFGSKDSPPVLVMHPARVLAECAAKRAIIEQAQDATDLDKYATDDWPEPRNLATQPYCGDVILRALASVYKDHPDYRQEWANG